MRIEGRIIVRVPHPPLNTRPMLNVQLHEAVHDSVIYTSSVIRHAVPFHSPRFGAPPLFSRLGIFHHVLADSSPSQGFDEFMNVVIDEAAEVYVKDAKPRRELGT